MKADFPSNKETETWENLRTVLNTWSLRANGRDLVVLPDKH